MKTKILTGIGFLFLFSGAMLGDAKKVIPCLVLLAIGSVVLFIAVKISISHEEESRN